MGTLTRYVFFRLFKALLLVIVSMTAAIWLTQSLRFLELIVSRGISVTSFLYLTVLLVPNFLSIAMPIALTIVTVFVFHRLLIESELSIMSAAGFSNLRIGKPALLLAAYCACLGYTLTLWAIPVAYGKFKDLHSDIRADYSGLLLQEGTFTRIGAALTVYIRARESNGDLTGIIVHDSRNPAQPLTLLAERGTLIQGDGAPRIILVMGNRQEVNRQDGTLSLLYFERYSVDLPTARSREEYRWREPGERLLPDLFWPNLEDANDRLFARRLVVEGHVRLTSPLYGLAMVALGLAAVLGGEFNRRGISKRILVGVALATTMQAGAIMLPSLAIRDTDFAFLMYLFPILGILGGVFWLAANGTKHVFRWRPRSG
jgi:lipopolysaccharide export system permease protein